MEDFTIPHEPAKNCSISVIEDEKEKVKDFVYKHFREVTDGPLFNISEESPIKEHRSSTKKDKPTLKAQCKVQQGAVFSGKILSFGCSVCKDDFTFSPNDLLKHFRAAHHGSLPTYPCDLCDFVTNEFPALQRHRIEHRNTLVTCELCNNGVQYSLLLLTRHYIMCHSINGHFKCDWCEFTTVDAGTFVQHIHHHNESHWKCSKCRHISLNEEDHQNHVKAHLDTLPFTCQICGFGASRSEKLRKHTASVHKGEAAPANSANLIRFKKSGESQEAQRMSELSHHSGSVPNRNGRLIKPELFLEETNHFMDGTVAKRDRSWSKSFHNTEHSTPVMLQECDNFLSSDVGSNINANGLTVVMVKNKISLPPNCTTKVMGFKMVDGKKHLVLKVIPTEKQGLSTQNYSIVDSVGPLVSHPVLGKSKASIENGQCSNCKSSTSHCLAVSTTCTSCLQMDQDDIMAVKVKVEEEEETSVFNFNSTPHTSNDGEQTNLLLNRSLTPAATLHPVTNELYHVGDQTYFNETTCRSKEHKWNDNLDSLTCKSDAIGHRISKISDTTTMSTVKVTSTVVQETLHTCSIPVFRKTLDNCGSSHELPQLTDGSNKLFEINKVDSAFHTMDTDPSSQITPEESDGLDIDIKSKNDKKKLETPIQPSQPISVGSTESAISTGKGTQNTPNQEVFTFHNYSKEIFSTLPNTTENFYGISGHKKTHCESSQFSLTLPESSEHLKEHCDIVIDENIVSVDDPLTEENADSVLQDFNIIKVEEESIPISTKQSETKSSSTYLGNFVEEHSDAIITQQLNKERTGSSIASHDFVPKTTLRILQLPEGKQPVLLKSTNSQFTKPVQVKAAPGFKIITNSTNPQINVSFLKPGLEQSTNTSGLTLTKDTKTAVPSAKPQAIDEGKTLFSAFKPGVNSTSNHYLISSPGLKGPVLLSSAPQCTPINKMAKTQPACYLVQRSVHLAKTPSTPTLKLTSTQFPLNSRPVLAMPKSSTEKPSTLQTGRQAFLLRYISPHKSGLFLNNQEVKSGTISNQIGESAGNKVILKIVTPTASLPPSGAATSSSQPLFLATRPQTKCFLVSSNKTNASASSGVKRLISIQKDVKKSNISFSQMNVKVQPCEAEKLMLAPRPIRPPSQRKRRRKALFDELPTTIQKARRLSNKVQSDKESTVLWKPVAKEVERTLRLAPFSLVQQVKCPRKYQPVVVLNHPDADIPEVANIMRVVNRYEGAVSKVSLCQKTIQALSDLSTLENNSSTKSALANNDNLSTRPVQSTVRERFLLKLKLRKKSKKKYEVVDRGSISRRQRSVVFDCWFCGRLFNNQEDWVGHGQRHLMEATRDWNKLF
ncbi:zinc finger protein 518A [Leuresthes tenuis]|uniref:zinc finger protein 518A n=1 Tax=Leuresthes tenuis TaxID=355514 RepID=UPI003B507075